MKNSTDLLHGKLIEVQLELDFLTDIAIEINRIEKQIYKGLFFVDDWKALKERIIQAGKDQLLSADILDVYYSATLRLLALRTELLMSDTARFDGK